MKFYKVPGYLAEVTKDGKYVRNLLNKKIKKSYSDKDGYKRINVKDSNYVNKGKGIHQLVALTFCKGYKKGLEVNHKDLDKSNNHYKNLEWTTATGNIRHAIRNGVQYGKFGSCFLRRGEKNGRAKLTWEQVIDIRFLYSISLYFQQDLANEFEVSRSLIDKVINHKIWI